VILAHDLQNLLTIIARCSDALSARLLGAAGADRDLTELNETVDRAFDLSRELLAAVGLQQNLEPVVIDVHELLERYRSTMQRFVGERVRITVNAEAAAALVEATPAQLEWILLNLLANGRDAMPEGGVLHIETAWIERWSGPPAASLRRDRYLRLTVRDEGRALTDDVNAAVFAPFFTTKTLGTGLGLTSVAVTVRALEGWLYVETLETFGTSVHVLLPLYPGAGRPAPPGPAG
jgi:signal transduction histidine kinase